MKKNKSLLILMVIMLMSISILPTSVFASVNKPTNIWNLSTKGQYEFYGDANVSELYTNYLLTGASSVKISVTNNDVNTLKIKLYKNGSLFSTSSVNIPAHGTTSWTVNGLSSSSNYYIKFYAPCHFEGYIKKV